jgi:hypothetical protein
MLVVVAPFQVTQPFAEVRYIGTFFYPSYGHYYGWNASGYNSPLSWASHYLPDFRSKDFDPSVQLYDSMNNDTIKWQMAMMRRATIDLAVTSWWGPNSYEDMVLKRIFHLAGEEVSGPVVYPLRWSILYEKQGESEPSINEILNDLRYIRENYGDSSNYFRIDGKLVIFVMRGPTDDVTYAEKWNQVRNMIDGFYFVLKVFSGYVHFTNYADSWFQYGPALRFETQENFSAYASPGFWKYDEAPRLSRDQVEFANALMRLYFEPTQFLLIETWNNWLEGTQIEPAYQVAIKEGHYVQGSASYGTIYIDLVRKILRGEERLTLQSTAPESLIGAASTIIAAVLITASVIRILRKGVRSGQGNSQFLDVSRFA